MFNVKASESGDKFNEKLRTLGRQGYGMWPECKGARAATSGVVSSPRFHISRL